MTLFAVELLNFPILLRDSDRLEVSFPRKDDFSSVDDKGFVWFEDFVVVDKKFFVRILRLEVVE